MPGENWQSRNDGRTKRSDCRVVVSAELKWLTVGGRPAEEALGDQIRVVDGKKRGGPWLIDTVCREPGGKTRNAESVWLNGDFENSQRF